MRGHAQWLSGACTGEGLDLCLPCVLAPCDSEDPSKHNVRKIRFPKSLAIKVAYATLLGCIETAVLKRSNPGSCNTPTCGHLQPACCPADILRKEVTEAQTRIGLPMTDCVVYRNMDFAAMTVIADVLASSAYTNQIATTSSSSRKPDQWPLGGCVGVSSGLSVCPGRLNLLRPPSVCRSTSASLLPSSLIAWCV